METPFYQGSWQGIDFKDIPAQFHTDMKKFYAEFYARLAARDQKDEHWVQQKIACAHWIEQRFLKDIPRTARMISLGAGQGVIERALLQHGYHIDLQDCQDGSMNMIRKEFPGIRCFVSDAADMQNIPDHQYDVTLAIALEYVFDKKNYDHFLHEVKRITTPHGRIIILSVSHVHPLTVIKKSIRSTISTIKRKVCRQDMGTGEQGVFWGWMRGLDDHWSALNKAGIRYAQCLSGLVNETTFQEETRFRSPSFFRYFFTKKMFRSFHYSYLVIDL